MYRQYSTRVQLLPPLQDELMSKARSMNFWLDQFARREALQSVPWRGGDPDSADCDLSRVVAVVECVPCGGALYHGASESYYVL